MLLKALFCSYELNTLDAWWIAVDVWSNSSRCRQESVYLSRTWCLYTWSYLDILITMLNSINCSTVIRLPTVILMLSREATSETYGPRVYLLSYKLSIYFYLHLYFLHLYYKIPKIYLSYHIISIRSHFRKWPWRDWQPLCRVGCEFFVCLCRCVGLLRSLLLDLYLGSKKLREILTLHLLHHPLLFEENQRKLKT